MGCFSCFAQPAPSVTPSNAKGPADASPLPHIPGPCTTRFAFMHYVDISCTPTPSVLATLANYCSQKAEKQMLQSMGRPEGRAMYARNILKNNPALLGVLQSYRWGGA